jgi:uncharacterized protein YbcI
VPNSTPRDEQGAGPTASEAGSLSIGSDGNPSLEQARLTGGELNAAITSALVGIHTDYLGRGPGRASTFHHGHVLVTLMHDVLTPAEKSLTRTRHTDAVEQIRHLFHGAMEADFREAVERLTGRRVLACIGGNHLEPDIAAEVFILDQSL